MSRLFCAAVGLVFSATSAMAGDTYVPVPRVRWEGDDITAPVLLAAGVLVWIFWPKGEDR